MRLPRACLGRRDCLFDTEIGQTIVFVPYAGSQFANLSAAEITAYAEKNTDGMTYYGTLGPVRPFRDWPFFSTAFLETRCLPRQAEDEQRTSEFQLRN